MGAGWTRRGYRSGMRIGFRWLHGACSGLLSAYEMPHSLLKRASDAQSAPCLSTHLEVIGLEFCTTQHTHHELVAATTNAGGQEGERGAGGVR